MGYTLPEHIVTAIDIGTTKICVLIARVMPQGALDIIGIGKAPSSGLAKGIVVDVAKTVHAIQDAVAQASLMAGVDVQSAVIGIAGSHMTAVRSSGVVGIHRKQITQKDIQTVLEAAQAIPLVEGQQIVHVLPQYFIIDGKERVADPLGMHGTRLEVQALIIIGEVSCVQNLVRCCQQADIAVSDIVLEQLASSHAVLSKDERTLGVAMLDIGGGTSDLAMYQRNSIVHTMVLPVAGNHITHDLAMGLQTTLADAERIKMHYGLGSVSNDELLEIKTVDAMHTKFVERAQLMAIIEPRVKELLKLVHANIHRHELEQYMPMGLVLSGGGSLLDGMQEMAKTIFSCPVRIGNPHINFELPPTLYNPIYATAYGLLLHALKQQQRPWDLSSGKAMQLFNRMKSWIVELF